MCGRSHQFPAMSAAGFHGRPGFRDTDPIEGLRTGPAAPTSARPTGKPDAATRIGDDERRDADAVLAQAMSLGYLTLDEWQVRSGQVVTATTAADVAAVVADLPVGELRRRDPVLQAERSAAVRQGIRSRTAGWLALAVLMIAIWLAVAIPTGAWYPWPVWPILGTGIGLVSHVVPARAALRS